MRVELSISTNQEQGKTMPARLKTLTLLTLMIAFAGTAAAGPKVDVCHVTGSGSILTLNVSQNALPAHLNHGDFLPLPFYADADGDGFGDAASSVEACEAPAGYAADGTDCDDSDAATHPGAQEIPGDGVDNDCNPDTPDVVVTCPCNQPGSEWAQLVAGKDLEDVPLPGHHRSVDIVCLEEIQSSPIAYQSGIYSVGDTDGLWPIVAEWVPAPGFAFCISLGGGAPVTVEEAATCEQDWRTIAALNGLTCSSP